MLWWWEQDCRHIPWGDLVPPMCLREDHVLCRATLPYCISEYSSSSSSSMMSDRASEELVHRGSSPTAACKTFFIFLFLIRMMLVK
ncbi:hypothetical protein EYF80_018308 [Liparis tanakae]|uniref:Uncharacterized protein n=1 Tax=Liparis tanakae TaxID=230148 RepID=A0A4Z2I2E1_9TELE|nr:hypothetical protein EYF80_018308 [Liparis tanakae]